MKVKCIRIINPITGNQTETSPWLTVGKEYIVLMISILSQRGGQIKFHVLSDEQQTPILFDSRQFEAVCTRIPSNWVIVADEQNNLFLGPKTWIRKGFWEDFFDNIPEIVSEFESEKAKIFSETMRFTV